MIVSAVGVATPTGIAGLRALNELLAAAVAAGAELVAFALRPLPTVPPRAADPMPGQLRLLAHGHGVALCAGPFALREHGVSFIACGLWDAEGELIGLQRQTHLTAEQDGWEQGDTLEVFRLAARDGGEWRVGIAGGEDIRYPEVSRILSLQGANLLAHLGAMPAPYNPWEQERRLWREVQSNQVFGVESYSLGGGFAGHARVLAPVEMTEGGRGILATTAGPDAPGLAVSSLDEQQRLEVIRRYPIHKFYNRRMYRNLPDACGG